MFFYLYQITNLVNGKIYIGVHQTVDMNDGYMGSGKVIKRAVAKYGIANFEKLILEIFPDSTLMYERERELVTAEFITRTDVYNIREGGKGGFDYVSMNRLNKTPAALAKQGASYIRTLETNPELYTSVIARLDKYRYKSHLVRKERYPEGTWKGKQHTDDTKQRMSAAKTGKGIGAQNSQYGTMWITNGTESRKVPQTTPMPAGFVKGKVLPKHTKCQVCDCDTGSIRAKYCKQHLLESRTRIDLDPVEVLTDYENGTSLQQMLVKYNWKSEQNIVGYLNKRFPARRRFKSGERTKLQ